MRTGDVAGDPRVVEREQPVVVDHQSPAPVRASSSSASRAVSWFAAQNRWCVRQSPSTRAARMKSSRQSTGSMRP